jgi:hypothetical protein
MAWKIVGQYAGVGGLIDFEEPFKNGDAAKKAFGRACKGSTRHVRLVRYDRARPTVEKVVQRWSAEP